MTRLFAGIFRRSKPRAGRQPAATGGRDYLAEELRRRKRRGAQTVAGAAGDESALVVRDPLEVGAHATLRLDLTAYDGPGTIPEELRHGIEPAVLKLLTPQLAREFGVVPLRVDGATIVFATAHEPTYKLQNEIRWLVGLTSDRARQPGFIRIGPELLAQCLDVFYPFAQTASLIPAEHDLLRMFAGRETSGASAGVLRPGHQGQSPVRSLVNGILMKAVYRGANDI